MGFVTIGLFTFNQQGVSGALMQMISHGLISAALFICVGVIYDRLHTREISRYGGLVRIMPKYAALFLLFTMASSGLPATSGFIGEFLVIMGSFKVNNLVALLAASGMVLGAAYSLWLYKRVAFGELVKNDLKKMQDINFQEAFMLLVLAALVLLIGIYPSFITDITDPSINALLEHIQLHHDGNISSNIEGLL